MGVVLDTSVLIAAERRTLDLARLLSAPGVESVAIAAITVSELLQGSLRTSDAGLRARRAAFADWIASTAPVLPFGTNEARRHAEIWAHLTGTGMTIDAHDMLIAATALAGGHAVATLNVRHFARVPGLRLVDVTPFATA